MRNVHVGKIATHLEALCNKNKAKYFRGAPYWTSEIYGFGKYIREYGYYPSLLPLCIYSDHGVGNFHEPQPHEINSDSPIQFYHSPQQVMKWKKYSKKPCFVLHSPFVYYRKSRNISKNRNAKGTIAFPSHSTPAIDIDVDIKSYVEQLNKLPKIFQPITVCLHMHDINKGVHKEYLNQGINVVTAGNTSDYGFTDNFYNILRKYNYSTSNSVGSYAFYSIEMGIPFFIYGPRAKCFNKSDKNLPLGKCNSFKISDRSCHYYKMLSIFPPTITPEIRTKVETDLGLIDGVGRAKMALLLYYSLIKFIFSLASVRWVIRLVKLMKKTKFSK